jgi:hypothetical protein
VPVVGTICEGEDNASGSCSVREGRREMQLGYRSKMRIDVVNSASSLLLLHAIVGVVQGSSCMSLMGNSSEGSRSNSLGENDVFSN